MSTVASPHGVTDRMTERTQGKVIYRLPPPLQLEPGSIVKIRMAAHVRSPGMAEYFSPAVVLAQYDDQWGSIDALVWDSSAGTHFANGYHIRELGPRIENGRPTGDMVETSSNIGDVLFSPDVFARMQLTLDELQVDFLSLKRLVQDLQGHKEANKAALQPEKK